jgi:hypothetical protein
MSYQVVLTFLSVALNLLKPRFPVSQISTLPVPQALSCSSKRRFILHIGLLDLYLVLLLF